MESRRLEKFIVGYFSTVGFVFLFSVGLNFLLPLFLSPTAGSEQIMAFSRLTSWIGRFFPLLYLFLLYKLWGDGRFVLKIGLAVYLSLIPFGIVFAFTFPIWIVLGLICIIYGFTSGLMKKNKQLSIQSEPLSEERPKTSWQRNLVFGGGFIAVLFGLFYFAFYGFRFPPCEYTDEVVTMPQELVGTAILLEKDQYLGRGKEKSDCSPGLKEIEYQIIDSESINNVTVGKRYFEGQGLKVEVLTRGKRFTAEKIIAQTKHGLGTIDSGPGPIYFLILRDNSGNIYKVATVFLGFDEKESYLGVYRDSQKITSLSSSYFRTFYGDKY